MYGLSPVCERSCTCRTRQSGQEADGGPRDASATLRLAQTCAGAHLEVVGGGVELPTALVLTAERLLADVGWPHLPVVLILQHNLRHARL